jgi:hypothetical protein
MEALSNQCLFCKSTENSFLSVEHIFPESLGNKDKILPKGVVCDKCNNEILSRLDAELLEFEPIKFFRTLNGIENKKGKIPVSNFNNVTLRNTDKDHIQIHANSKKNITDQTAQGFNLNFRGNKKMDAVRLKLLARSLYKIVLELMVLDHGKDFVLTERFDDIRDIILGKKDFNGYLLIGSNEKSENPRVTYHLKKDNIGEFIVVDFNYLFIRILFDMERRTIPIDNGTKLGRLTLSKF